MARKHDFSVGDRVGYSARLLRSVQGDIEMSERRGTIHDIWPGNPVRYRVRWDDDPTEAVSCIASAIARVGSAKFSTV